jgi:Tfp pilus assembly protein PilN
MLPPELDEINDYEETEEGEETAGSGGKIVRWLVLLGIGILFAPLYLMGTTLKASKLPLQDELSGIQATLSATPSLDPTEQAMAGRLAELRSQINDLDSVQSTLSAAHIDWPSVMSIIASYDQGQMSVTGLAQTGSLLTLSGQANDENVIMAYANLLRQSNQLASVSIESITYHEAPTAIPPRAAVSTPQAAQAAQTQATFAEFILRVQLKAGSTP